LIVFLTGMTVMLVITYAIRPLMGIQLPLGNDAYDGYFQLAQNLARGYGFVFEPGGHVVFHRPPLYPVLLIPGTFLAENWARIYVAALNSCLLAGATTLLRSLVATAFGRRAGIIAWAILAFNPFILWSVKNPMAPICQLFAFTWIIFCSFQVYRTIVSGSCISWRQAMGCAAAFLSGIYCHGTMLVDTALLFVLLGCVAIYRREWRTFRYLVCIAFSVVICVAPWTWRNYKVTGLFIPVVGNSGYAYFVGNAHWGISSMEVHPGEDPRTAGLRFAGYVPEDFTEMLDFYGLKDARWEKEINRRFKEHVKTHPGAFVKKVFFNAVEYYFPIIYYILPPPGSAPDVHSLRKSMQDHLEVIPLTLYHLTLIILAFYGLGRIWKNRSTRDLAFGIVFCWAIYAVPYFPFLSFVGHGLYTFGTIPVLAIAVGVGIARPQLGRAKANHCIKT
jgi:hypothetical protein